MKAIEHNENNQKCQIWNISSILSNIFAYTDHKDLIEFNTVCRKWNNLSNPIIYKSIKLNRRRDTIEQVYDKKLSTADKIEADAVECIFNNTKHAHLVKEFNYMHKLKPQRAIEVFETFRFIRNLGIRNCDMSQDQFICMVSPLTQLQELTLVNLNIKRITYKRLCKEAIKLPPTLKKLKMCQISLINNPELFVQTINSHSNLVEFFTASQCSQLLLAPFYKNYPSLLNIEFYNIVQQSYQHLFTIFENNPQLISLKLSFECSNSDLLNRICSYLINLEELKLYKIDSYSNDYKNFIAKFSQPTKIKKLNIDWAELSNCSLNSILLNCPYLEELSLNRFITYKRTNYVKFINLYNPTKLKKLAIDCASLTEDVLDSLLLNCPNLSELDIILPCEWKKVMKSIYEKCAKLERMFICPSDQIYLKNLDDSFKMRFYESEFFTSSPKCNTTLTHLTLKGLKAVNSKAEYFNNFKRLHSIKYLSQFKVNYNSFVKEPELNIGLWPGYRLIISNVNLSYDAEFKR
jgi:hypothetical protein